MERSMKSRDKWQRRERKGKSERRKERERDEGEKSGKGSVQGEFRLLCSLGVGERGKKDRVRLRRLWEQSG